MQFVCIQDVTLWLLDIDSYDHQKLHLFPATQYIVIIKTDIFHK